MYPSKKTRLYISDLLPDPALSYPSYYTLSPSMHNNEILQSTIVALHSFELSYYTTPKGFEDIFAMLESGGFPLYKEHYIVGYFGGKLMVLEPNGWRGMPATKELFTLENWLVF